LPNPHAPQLPELPPTLANDICTAFDLGEPLGSQKITSGLMHTNYFLDTETGSYVTRFLGYVAPDMLENERHVQTQLRQNGVPATYMLATKSGELLHATHDNNVTVAEKLPGVHPGRPARNEDCLTAGQVLGNFHQAVSSVAHSKKRFALLGQDSTAYRVAKLTERGVESASALDQLRAQHVDTVFDPRLPAGVLHGDFHSENVLVEDGVGAVLDLETAISGPFVLDIGRSLLDFCHRSDGKGMDEQKMDHFLKGYARVRPLTSQEEGAVPSAIAFGCVSVASWLYLKKYDELGGFFLGIGASAEG